MAVYKAGIVGSYPRNVRVAEIHRKLLKGVIGLEEFERLISYETERLLKLFVRAGLDAFSDGMLRWDDLLNPLIRFVDGVKVNGLVRFYDNNFFYRAPVVEGDPVIKEQTPFTAWCNSGIEALEKLGAGDGAVLKQPLPGPATLASSSIAEGSGLVDLVEKWWGGVLEPLAKELSGVGCLPEFHEPEIVWNPSKRVEWRRAVELVSRLGKGWFVTYFRPADPVADLLTLLGEGFVVAIDAVAGSDVEKLVGMGVRRIAVGVVDARNTKMERCGAIARYAKRVANLGAEEVFVTNNTVMDFLPEPVARKKVRLLGRVKRRLGKGV